MGLGGLVIGFGAERQASDYAPRLETEIENPTAKHVREQREQLGLPQQKLADLADTSQSSVQRIETTPAFCRCSPLMGLRTEAEQRDGVQAHASRQAYCRREAL